VGFYYVKEVNACMETFKIPVEWSVYATVEIEAESLEEAIRIFDETIDDIPLPTDPNYIDDSFKRCSQDTGKLEDDINYYKLFN
jgi:hypothetical protein